MLFIEAMADAAVSLGIKRDDALKIAAGTIMGSGKLCLDTGTNPAVLKDMVCSPGGTTIAGVMALEENGFRNAVIKSVTAAYDKTEISEVTIYTDGACSGNPGPGGWAAILIAGNFKKELSGGEAQTTNNRMELAGVINGLRALKRPCKVTIYSDSAYVVNAFNQNWLAKWMTNGWKNSAKAEVANADLWKELAVLTATHQVTFSKVKGHADDELNNRCDELAVAESRKFK